MCSTIRNQFVFHACVSTGVARSLPRQGLVGSQHGRHRLLAALEAESSLSQALSVGIFPYVLKLLQAPAVELREVCSNRPFLD